MSSRHVAARRLIGPRLAVAVGVALAFALVGAFGLPRAAAQDMKPDPADVEAVKAVMKKATAALLHKDAKGFVACCDDYIDVFFLDGTLMKGKKKIAATLHEFFTQRPAQLVVTLDVAPRSFRVLTHDVVMVDWPATVKGPNATARVNTLTTLRKVDGTWSITSYLESVPFTQRIGGRNVLPPPAP